MCWSVLGTVEINEDLTKQQLLPDMYCCGLYCFTEAKLDRKIFCKSHFEPVSVILSLVKTMTTILIY